MKIHFIGIKGISMEFLATLCKSYGNEISGSDLRLSGHSEKNVAGADVAVYSYAIGENNPEYIEAKRLGIPLLSRAELLGKISRKYEKVIAVSGTHGKTTTTAMLMSALKDMDPTVHVGGTVNGKLGKIGGRELFVTEACEYHESFLSLEPNIGIVLNVELDHADYFKTYASFYDAFEKFSKQTKTLFVCGDNEARRLKGLEATYTFGFNEENDYRAILTGSKEGYFTFSALYKGKPFAEMTLNIRGRHNVLNALSVIAVCHHEGYSFSGIRDFKGVDRRFESLGKCRGIEYISDYAHHPHEIQCTLELAKSIYGRVLTVFEPHTYSRTQAFFKELAVALSASDRVIVLPIYAAREKPIRNVDAGLIAREGGFEIANSYEQASQMIRSVEGGYDAVIFMGAGSVDELARRYFALSVCDRK